MPRKNPKLETMPRKSGALARKTATGKPVQAQPPLVSGRWLLSAVGITLAGAALCGWLALCLLFWQGSWQLLYHPQAAVEKTPASAGLAFSPVAFAATDEGEPRLKGWWIPAAPGSQYGRLTVLDRCAGAAACHRRERARVRLSRIWAKPVCETERSALAAGRRMGA